MLLTTLNYIYLLCVCAYYNIYFDASVNNIPICEKYSDKDFFTYNGIEFDTRYGISISVLYFIIKVLFILTCYLKLSRGKKTKVHSSSESEIQVTGNGKRKLSRNAVTPFPSYVKEKYDDYFLCDLTPNLIIFFCIFKEN